MARLSMDMPHTTVVMKMRGVRRYRVRLILMGWLMSLAGLIGGDQIDVTAEIDIAD